MLTLEQVVGELVEEFFDERDVPAGHRCTTVGPNRCSHEERARRPLLVRLSEIVMPGTGAPRAPESKQAKGTRGSPAPWSSAPAHLVDEVHRGAVRFDRALRADLDLGPLHVHRGIASKRRVGPLCSAAAGVVGTRMEGVLDRVCPHPSCQPVRKAITTVASATPADVAGPAALRGLPLLVELLLERDATNQLVAGPLVNAERPDRGRSWGLVERTVRRWHAAAKGLTGHEDRPIIIRQRVNPFAHEYWPGPRCQDPWSCPHTSCRLVDLAQRPRWEAASCPHCGSRGFAWDPIWGVLRCDHPRCRDEDGRRPSWSMDGFMAPINDVVDAARKAGVRD